MFVMDDIITADQSTPHERKEERVLEIDGGLIDDRGRAPTGRTRRDRGDRHREINLGIDDKTVLARLASESIKRCWDDMTSK
jgi:hypothetical protein